MRRALCVGVVAVLAWFVVGVDDTSWARQEPAERKASQSADAKILRLVEPGTELKVFLKDGSRVEGVLRELHDDVLIVEHKKGGGSSSIMLSEIQRLEIEKQGLRTATKVFIIVGSVLGGLLVLGMSTCSVA